MNVIFGNSGAAKEIDWLISELSLAGKTVSKHTCFVGLDHVGENIHGTEIIHESHFFELLNQADSCNAYLAFGNSLLRKKVYTKLSAYQKISYPSLIHPSVVKDERPHAVQMGQGSFIAAGNVLMTHIKMGDFAYINIGNTIGHDCQFGSFVTLSPGCRISGNVTIGDNTFLGAGAIVLDRVTIADNTIIGAGCVVNKDITEPGTYVGVPARKVK